MLYSPIYDVGLIDFSKYNSKIKFLSHYKIIPFKLDGSDSLMFKDKS